MYSFFWTADVENLINYCDKSCVIEEQLNRYMQKCFPLCKSSFIPAMRKINNTDYGRCLSTIVAYDNKKNLLGLVQMHWNAELKKYRIYNYCFLKRINGKRLRGLGKMILTVALGVMTEIHPDAICSVFHARLHNIKLQSAMEKMGWQFTTCMYEENDNIITLQNKILVEYEWPLF